MRSKKVLAMGAAKHVVAGATYTAIFIGEGGVGLAHVVA